MESKNSKAIQWLAISIIAASVIISGTILYTKNQSNFSNKNTQEQQQTKEQQTVTNVDIVKVKISGEPFVGNINAPVVVAYWFDYQCPFCKRFEEESIDGIVNDYVKKGKVKVVFKDYQFLGPDSITAGLAEQAVWETAPDKFYEWQKAMFDKQDGENSGWGNKKDVLALTKSLGIDSAKVDNLMTSKAVEYQKEMDDDKAEGLEFGIQGTPGSIIGNELIAGAYPYSQVKAAIEAVLNGK